MRFLEEQTAELPRKMGRGPFKIRVTSAGQERVRVLRLGQSLTLGSGEEADLQLEDPAVSSVHCRLQLLPEGLEVVDLESRNGVVLGGACVRRALLIGPRGEFSLGASSVRIENHESAVGGESMGLVGVAEGMRRLRDSIARFAALRAPVLILGESGTGKDLVARALHEQSKRSGSYVPMNVAALPETLLDAELFGHARGAFTGAVTQRMGAFALANKGTLFLDELAELSLAGQAKLLRVVEDGVVRAVGATEATRVETRIVSATCAPLEERMATGQFRHDLFHRLSMLVIEVPPLRQRTSDLPLLAEAFFRAREEELGHKYLLPETVEFLAQQRWPGNVRQYFGALYRAAVFAEGGALSPSHFHLIEPKPLRASAPRDVEAVSLLERYGSVSAAARAVGIPRTSFRTLLARERRKRSGDRESEVSGE